MNPSILLSPNPVAVQRVEKDLSKYTSYRIVRLFGHNLLQTSYFFKPSYIAESLSDSSSLSPEGAAKRDFFLKQNPTGKLTETEWGEIADADGLPKEIPVSVWGARTLKKQRAILNDAVWNDKLFNNVNAVLVSMEITRPGIYTPPLFEGPPGASKTYSILIASALLGRPAMVVVGDPSLSGTVQRDLLRGGDGASVNNRPRMLADQAYHGVFNQPAARAQYYREIQKVIKSGGAPDFFTAHDVLSQNNEQNNSIWNRIGDIEGIGGEGSIAAKKYGKAEIGRLNGAMIVFDEVNVINPVYHTVLEEFLSSKEDQNPINCEFSMTANPPTEENVNRSHLTYPLLNRCRRKTIEPLTGSEYGQMIATQLGISQPYQIQSGGKTISIYDELTRVLKEDGVSDEEVQTLLPAAQGKSFISSFLTEDSVRKIASRLGGFHAEIEEKARKGGDLHSSSYGLEQMPDTVSYRQLQSTLLMWDSFAYNMALEKTGSVDSLNKEILVESLVKALDENYVQVFAYTNSSGDSQFARGGVAAINSSGLVKDLLSSNQLTAEHISSDLTVVNKNEMNKNVEKLASDVLGRPATKNEIRKLGGLLSEIVGDSAIPSLQFNKEKITKLISILK